MPISATAKKQLAKIAAWRVKKRQDIQAAIRLKYEFNPIGWIRERIGGYVYGKTAEVALSVRDERRTAVPSCHEAGKSWLSSRLACWWLDVHPAGEAFVVTTAPTGAQVRAILWREINRAHREYGLPGRTNQTEWWINDELVAFGRKPSDYDEAAFQGIHAKYVLVIIDEACGVPAEIFRAANSLIANEYGRLLAIGNPDASDTYFAEICSPGSGWNVIPISYLDTPNFTNEEAPQNVKDVLVGPLYIEELRRDVGEDSPIFKSKALGQFSTDNPLGVVLLSDVTACQHIDRDYTVTDLLPVELGVDVGAGGDETVIRERRGVVAGREWSYLTPEPKDAAGYVMLAIRETGATRVKIDVIGIGWALCGWLESLIEEAEITCEIVRVDVRGVSLDPARFPKLRDQLWWELGREQSQQRRWDLQAVSDTTVAQLIAPKWKPDASGRYQIEPKEVTKTSLKGKSPDKADALLLAYYVPPSKQITVWTQTTEE